MQDHHEMTAEEQEMLTSLDEIYAQWKRKVEEEGRREGQRSTLLRQLRVRFGVLPSAVVDRIEAAESSQLDAWVDRVVTAASLDEVLRET